MKNVFTRLTAKTLKANRTRTMVTIIGILLATAMLTAVTTFISSLQHYMLENVIAENGDWHGEAMQIPEKKVEELERELSEKDQEIYEFKHEMITAQIRLENAEKEAKALEERHAQLQKELVRLEAQRDA